MSSENMASNSTSRTINWAQYQLSLVLGAVILPVSIWAYCIFLFSLQRGTPLIWPYATEIVDPKAFQSKRYIDATDKDSFLTSTTPLQCHITLMNEEYKLKTQEVQKKNVYLIPTETDNIATFNDPGFHQSTVYEGTTLAKLDKGQYLLLGGIEEPLTTLAYGKHVMSYATKLTWITKDSQLKPGPSMSFPRAQPHLLKLDNGNTLVTGGILSQVPLEPQISTEATQTIEEYDSKQNRFIPLGRMQIPRYEHSVCQLQNGNFLIVSGRTSHRTSDSQDNLTASIEIFSPKTNKSWIVGQLHSAMAEPILIPLKDGRIAIFDKASLSQSDMFAKPYLEIFTGTQEPVQKLPHLPSIAEILHPLGFWR